MLAPRIAENRAMTTAPPVESPRRKPGAAQKLALGFGIAVVVWFAGGELATHFWYAFHEAKLPRNRELPDGPVLVQRIDDFARPREAR